MTNRPFYTDFAWAYDQILEEPGQEHYDHIAQIFASAGSAPGSRLLDAGCGAGRYALALARRGYQVIGVDAAPLLLQEAQRKAAQEQLALTFEVGNLLNLTAETAFDGILCRGVLNDLLDDASREIVFQEFAQLERPYIGSYSLALIALLVSLDTISLQTGPGRIRQFGCNSTRNHSADGTNDYLRLNQGHDERE
ncbi:MAG TPA: class I SAM-dependent methyltransferase [Ktedonobacteraceae bacterium]|nr:class I SAM-dependent methyltransferase [Ktedonobacteraceae bacterium]